MEYIFRILLEAFSVGLSAVVIGFPISTGMMFVSDKNFTWGEYRFWWEVALAYFLTGFFLHLIFEGLGWNLWYCKDKLKQKQK